MDELTMNTIISPDMLDVNIDQPPPPPPPLSSFLDTISSDANIGTVNTNEKVTTNNQNNREIYQESTKMTTATTKPGGKNQKLAMIDHVEAQIRRVDIYTEEMLERLEKLNAQRAKEPVVDLDSRRRRGDRDRRGSNHRGYQPRELTIEKLEKGREKVIEELRNQLESMLKEFDMERKSGTTNTKTVLERRFVFVLVVYYFENYARFPILLVNTDFMINPEEIELIESLVNASRPSRCSSRVGHESDVLNDRVILTTEMCKAIEKRLSQDDKPSSIQLTHKEILGIRFFNLQSVKVKRLSKINLPSLRCFALCHQPLEQIAPNAFEGLPELESLFMFSNNMNLTEEHAKLFRPLTSCSKINLSFNQIEYIDVNAFNSVFSLRELNLSSNRLTFTHENETMFENLPNLKVLNIGYNTMEHVSARMFRNLINLQQLVLRGCKVLEVDEDAFATLTSLKTIDLTSNSLKKLPDRLFQGLVSLEDINLLNNDLEGQSEEFFDGLVNLRSMWLSANKFKKCTAKMFKSLIALQDLYIGNNELKQLDINAFDALINLQKLDISYNPDMQSFIKSGMFLSLVNLKSLSLENIGIDNIPDWLFDGLVHLEILMLGKNQLSKLTRASVLGLSGLKKLNLEANQFVEFDLDIIDYLKRIEVVVLTRNPIKNPRELREFRLKDKMIFQVDMNHAANNLA